MKTEVGQHTEEYLLRKIAETEAIARELENKIKSFETNPFKKYGQWLIDNSEKLLNCFEHSSDKYGKLSHSPDFTQFASTIYFNAILK